MMSKKLTSVEEWMLEIEKNTSWYDKHISIPFHHKVINPIRDFYNSLKQLPKNIKRWWPALWGYRTWDSVYTLQALRIGLEGQLENFEYAKNERGWYHVGIDKDMKNIKVCINLIKKIEKDNYCLEEYKVFNHPTSKYKRMHKQEKNDVDYLMNQLKDIRGWWD